MIFPPSIPKVYLTLMIKGTFLKVEAASDVHHINNMTCLSLGGHFRLFSCPHTRNEVELRLSTWLNQLDTQPQWPRLKLLLLLLYISFPWILSHKVRLTESGIYFFKSTKSDVRQKMCTLLWLINFISQGRLTNIRNQNIYLARSWQTIPINSYCTVK